MRCNTEINLKLLFISGNLFPAFAGDSIFSQGLLFRLAASKKIHLCSYGTMDDFNDSILSKCGNIEKVELIDRLILERNMFSRFIRGSIKQVYTQELFERITKLMSNYKYDFIILDHLRVHSLLKRNSINNTKLIYIAHNVEYENFLEGLKMIESKRERLSNYLLNYRLKSLEKSVLNKSDSIWVLSKEDKTRLVKAHNNLKDKKFSIIPAYFPYDLIKNQNSYHNRTKKILILGSMNWYPNVEGAIHFIDEIFPDIKKADSQYQLYIVGQKPDNKIRSRASDSIIITGKVDSVDPYIKICDLLIIPNKLGTGIKIKLMEAVMKGIPVVGYANNFNGYNIAKIPEGFIVKEPKALASSILAINDSPSLKKSFIDNFEFSENLHDNIFRI